MAGVINFANLNNTQPTADAEAVTGFDMSEYFGGTPNDYSLMQSEYDFNYRVFPENLGGQTYVGHYMVININSQTSSDMNIVNGKTIATRFEDSSGGLGELSKTDALRFTLDNNFKNAQGTKLGQTAGLYAGFSATQGVDANITRPRFTRRIKESIALYMPNAELTFNDAHDFENISLTKFGADIAGGLVTFAAAGIGAIFGGATAGAGAAQVVGAVSDSLSGDASGAAVLGRPINPKVEVLYANTMQREHRFDFIFAASTPKEAETIRQIIRTLRYHAAPELSPSGIGSFFWIPPAEFDITFFYRGNENLKIPRINTCALTNIDVSYSPNGTWSTFHDGHPTQIRMQLAFREVEVTHKLRVLQGF